MKNIVLYHGSNIKVEFPEIRKTKYTKTFHGDFIVRMIMNKPISGLIENQKKEL